MKKFSRRKIVTAALALAPLGVAHTSDLSNGEGSGTIAAATKNRTVYLDTATELLTSNIHTGVLTIKALGYASPGDGGDVILVRRNTRPEHGAFFTSLDGAFWEVSDAVVNPKMLGAKIDGSTDDTDAWKKSFSINRPVFHPGGISLVSDVICSERPMLSGAHSTVLSTRSPGPSVIRCTQPGITPLTSFHETYIENIAFEFGQIGIAPIGNLKYARALELRCSLAYSGGRSILDCPTGGLSRVSAGTTIVFPDIASPMFDYFCNNFDSFDQVFIIKEVLSDTKALLFAPKGVTKPLQTVYARGNAFASIYRFDLRPGDQPTRIMIKNCEFRNIPGFGMVFTGAQQVDIEAPYGGGHLGTVGCFPERGQSFYRGGTYHHFRLRGGMNFQYSAGVIFAGGLVDSEISQCQADPNGISNPDIGQLFCSKVAQYALYRMEGGDIYGCSIEDTTSPSGIYLEHCAFLHVRSIHAHKFTGETIALVGCSDMSVAPPRITQDH